jgi:hypothetical protein
MGSVSQRRLERPCDPTRVGDRDGVGVPEGIPLASVSHEGRLDGKPERELRRCATAKSASASVRRATRSLFLPMTTTIPTRRPTSSRIAPHAEREFNWPPRSR